MMIKNRTAKLAKEKGFKSILFEDDLGPDTFPTQSELQTWLRDIHNIRVYAIHGCTGTFNFEIYIWDKPNNIGKWTRIGNISSFERFEEALEQGLIEALKLI